MGAKMIRRAANVVTPNTTTATATGWVLGWFIIGTSAMGQSMAAAFESNQNGTVIQVPLTNIQFEDGGPAVVATID